MSATIELVAVAKPDGTRVSPWFEDWPDSTPLHPGQDANAQARAYRLLHHAFAGYILIGQTVMVTVPAEEVV